MAGFCLCVDDLFYSMLVTLRQKGIKPDKLTYKEMKLYGNDLIDYAKTKNLNLYMYLCRESTSKCLYSHRDFIKESIMYCDYKGFKLIKECTDEELDDEFRVFMPLDLRIIIDTDEEFISKIVNKYSKEHGLAKTDDDRIYWDNQCYFHIEDLYFNMLITLKQAGIDVSTLTYRECEDYGAMVQKRARNEGINLILSLSRDQTYKFYENYGEYVEEEKDSIKIKDGITVHDLIEICSGYLSYKMFKIITSENLKEEIVNYYNKTHEIKQCTEVSRKRKNG